MTILLYTIFLAIISLSIVIFLMLFSVLILDSLIWRHDLPTSRRAIGILSGIISQRKPNADNFYDIGCARGTLSLAVKKKHPRLAVCGIDNSAIRILFAKMKSVFLRRKVTFAKQDVFQADLRNADIVYTYLWYDLMPPLERKLQKELKKGALVITNTSSFPNWKPIEKHAVYPDNSAMQGAETLFVYIRE
jgi:SAM-dependent methyltransferase